MSQRTNLTCYSWENDSGEWHIVSCYQNNGPQLLLTEGPYCLHPCICHQECEDADRAHSACIPESALPETHCPRRALSEDHQRQPLYQGHLCKETSFSHLHSSPVGYKVPEKYITESSISSRIPNPPF